MYTFKQNDDKIDRIYWYIIQLAMCPLKVLVAFVFRIMPVNLAHFCSGTYFALSYTD